VAGKRHARSTTTFVSAALNGLERWPMSIEDMIGYRDEEPACVVCGKALKPGEALAKMHKEGRKLLICCPLCLDAYEKDPNLYLERLAKRTLARELAHSVLKQ
jgi:hypothetical protein